MELEVVMKVKDMVFADSMSERCCMRLTIISIIITLHSKVKYRLEVKNDSEGEMR